MTTLNISRPVAIPAKIEKQLLSVEMLPVDQLVVDHTYQRNPDPSRQRYMAEHWNWNACGTLAVSLRKERGNNQYAVIDGQQRLGTLTMMRYKEAPCRIYIDLTKEEESELFELLNTNKKPTNNDVFKARLSRKEEVANNIRIAAEAVNYHLDPDRKHSSASSKDSHFYIQTMIEMEKMYKAGGAVHIMDTLRLVKELFAPEHLHKQAMILSGVGLFIRTYPDIDKKQLLDKVKRTGLMKLTQNAFQYQAARNRSVGVGVAFCEAMLYLYNQNRQDANKIRSKNN